MRTQLVIGLLCMFFAAAVSAQEAIDDFELDTETSFFEAQNAQRQLRDSKDRQVKEQEETRQAQERSVEITKKAEDTRKRAETERVEIEKNRMALEKERADYNKKIKEKSAEIQKLNREVAKEQRALEALRKEVKGLKAQTAAQQRKIEEIALSRRDIRARTERGREIRVSQKRLLDKNSRILNTTAQKENLKVKGRAPASVKGPDMNVTLKPNKSE